jgi:hypothetical protein
VLVIQLRGDVLPGCAAVSGPERACYALRPSPCQLSTISWIQFGPLAALVCHETDKCQQKRKEETQLPCLHGTLLIKKSTKPDEHTNTQARKASFSHLWDAAREEMLRPNAPNRTRWI